MSLGAPLLEQDSFDVSADQDYYAVPDDGDTRGLGSTERERLVLMLNDSLKNEVPLKRSCFARPVRFVHCPTTRQVPHSGL